MDLWSGKDQSGNNPEATRDNAAAGGVADRVELHTADMTALPFEDGSFDVVTSALAIHNIPTRGARHRAVDEAMRVLRPGGLLVVADFWWAVKEYAAHLDRARPGHPDSGAGRQPTTVRPLGPGYWYGGPWFAVSLLRAVKESPTAAA
ncbi:class I SAM-dependent methyltransferase [Streptacidiphilus monticola]